MLLSLAAVLLECKLPVCDTSSDILELHIFVAVQVQFEVQHWNALLSYSMQMFQKKNSNLGFTARAQ